MLHNYQPLPPKLVNLSFPFSDKFKEHFEKLIECGKKLPDPEPCLAVLQTLLQGLDVDDEVKRDSIFLTLSELFLRQKEVPEKWKKLVRVVYLQHHHPSPLLIVFPSSMPSRCRDRSSGVPWTSTRTTGAA